MIRLIDLTKTYYSNGVRTTVAAGINLTIPTGSSVALLGRNGAGKSSLLRMIAGTMRPTSGRIDVEGTVSWPVGFAGSFHGDLSGVQNVRFVARIYGIDTDQLTSFVEEFAELGDHFHLPFRTYSSGMKARLGFAVSMGIAFDTYLIDEVTSVGDASFREKSEVFLHDRLKTSGAIVVSHNLGLLKRMCTAGIIVENGRAVWFDDIDEAISVHRQNMNVA